MTGTIPAEKVRTSPPAPRGFDPLTASKVDLARHGLPQRPDPRTRPGPATLWEQRARRYRDYEHLAPSLTRREVVANAGFGLSPLLSCGFELIFAQAPITVASATWTVPNLVYNPAPGNSPIEAHTFFGLGFLDVHTEMSVNSAGAVTSFVAATGSVTNLPARPGDTISATLCLQTDAAGTASIFLANDTTKQTLNFTVATGFPPAHAINAGVSRGSQGNGLPAPLAGFGSVYFDELSAFAPSGFPRLVDGTPTTMVERTGAVLARPQRLSDFTFRVDHA